jgi:hypothetical protein
MEMVWLRHPKKIIQKKKKTPLYNLHQIFIKKKNQGAKKFKNLIKKKKKTQWKESIVETN